MDLRSHSYESSLLFEAPGTSDPAGLADLVRGFADRHALPLLRLRAMDGIFLHADCGAIQLLLALSPDPLPVEHFLEANRPAAATVGEHTILRRLTRAGAYLTVFVLDHPDAAAMGTRAPARAKRDLCWALTGWLADRTEPDLVFWNAGDTLYTAGEFRRRRDFLDAQMAAPAGVAAGDRHRHLRADPDLNPDAAAWFADGPALDGAEVPAACGRDDALEADIGRLSRRGVLMGLAALPSRPGAARALRGVAMACTTATVGLSSAANLGVTF